MFGIEKDALVAGLEAIRRRLCVYDFGGDFPPPATCDCKFGASGSGEQTGCPELREAIVVIEGRWADMTLTKELFEANARNAIAEVGRILDRFRASEAEAHTPSLRADPPPNS